MFSEINPYTKILSAKRQEDHAQKWQTRAQWVTITMLVIGTLAMGITLLAASHLSPIAFKAALFSGAALDGVGVLALILLGFAYSMKNRAKRDLTTKNYIEALEAMSSLDSAEILKRMNDKELRALLKELHIESLILESLAQLPERIVSNLMFIEEGKLHVIFENMEDKEGFLSHVHTTLKEVTSRKDLGAFMHYGALTTRFGEPNPVANLKEISEEFGNPTAWHKDFIKASRIELQDLFTKLSWLGRQKNANNLELTIDSAIKQINAKYQVAYSIIILKL